MLWQHLPYFFVPIGCLALAACGEPSNAPPFELGSDSATDVAMGAPDTAEPPSDVSIVEPSADALASSEACDPTRLRVSRVEAWPGGGVAAHITVFDEAGAPVTALDERGVAIVAEGNSAGPVALSALAGPGLVALVVVPAEGAAHQARQEAALKVLADLPRTDAVAVYSAGTDGLALLADLSTRRARARQQVQSLPPGVGSSALALLARDVERALDTVDPEEGPPHRQVWVIDAEIWSPSSSARFALEDAGLVAPRVEAERAASRRVAACLHSADAPLTVFAGGFGCPLERAEPAAWFGALPCDAAAAAQRAYPYGHEVHLELDAAQLEAWQAAYDAKSKDDFTLSVRFGDGPLLSAEARFRGQTSLDCARKSYRLNLAGGDRVRMGRGIASDHALLISMCKDDGYFQQALANRLLAPMGLFPLDFRFVRLLRNGINEGIYLLLEEPERALPDASLGVDTVLRRRFDPENEAPDLELPTEEPGASIALAFYDEIVDVAATAPSEELPAELAARFDVDAYLRWMAFNSFVLNGDYVDELFLYGQTSKTSHPYLRPLGWDPDDLFSACHHSGKWALEDPFGMLYCAEAKLDDALLRSQELYTQFAAHLSALVHSDVPDWLVEDTALSVRDELFALLDEPTARAMVELRSQLEGDPGASEVKNAISARVDELLADMRDRRQELAGTLSALGLGEQ